MRSIGSLALLLWILAGCASSPSGPPEEVAPRIVTALDAGDEEEASELFEGAPSELLYPLLYEEARGRHGSGDGAGAARVLRFMATRYPRARAVREALVYSLFLERAAAEPPTPELLAELETRVAELRAEGGEPPVWIALVEAQLAVDRGRPNAAIEALATFHSGWDGRPEELAVYVDDLERYVATHFTEDSR